MNSDLPCLTVPIPKLGVAIVISKVCYSEHTNFVFLEIC